MHNIGYYIFVLVALMVAFLVVKKVASCMIARRWPSMVVLFMAILLAIVVALAAIYYLYFM